MKIFLIGPGGVGKSTAGKILVQKLKSKLVDLDLEFINRVGNIELFIEQYGYKNYCYKNSELFHQLLEENTDNTVFILSSGFLVHKGLDELTSKHAKLLKANGTSILLLPSQDINETVEIVVKRQVKRGFGLKEKHEKKKIKERYSQYLTFGDIQIFSQDEPDAIADEMMKELVGYDGFS